MQLPIYKVKVMGRKIRKSSNFGHRLVVFMFCMAMVMDCAGNLKKGTESVSKGVTIEATEDEGDPSLNIPDSFKKYLPVIKKYSRIYGFDWRLALAVVKKESDFNPNAISHKGAYGLFQIMPKTGKELVKMVVYITNYRNPKDNIIAGLHYLWIQYNRFFNEETDSIEALKLALAAYNAGPGRVIDAQKLASYLGEDPNKWESVKMTLPLLSRKYSSLHRYIWENAEPPSGYFENYDETINYVDKIFEYYENYMRMFPDK